MSKPEVFIIESLSFKDEEHKRFEGKFLSQILQLGKKNSKYYYIRTKKELKEVLKLFDESNYRYLHISCHGDDSSLSTTLDTIEFSELSAILSPHLRKKRLFISACSAVNAKFAKALLPGSGCYSLSGPRGTISFNKAAIVWASFYHLAFEKNSEKMSRNDLGPILEKISNTFEVSLLYYYILNGKLGYADFDPTPELKKPT